MSAQLEELRTDWRSVPYLDERLRGPVDRDEEDDEPGLWARFVEEAGPHLFTLARRLPGRERFVVLSQLAGHSTEHVSRALGVTTSSVQRTRKRALSLLLRRMAGAFPRTSRREASLPSHDAVVDSSARFPPRPEDGATTAPSVEPLRTRPRIQCAVPYCCRLVELAPSSLELNAFCQDHQPMKTKTRASTFKGFNLEKHEVSIDASDLSMAEQLCAPCSRLDARVVEVTPALAAALLRRGAWEGWLSRKLVATYASDMKAGAWRLSHQGIAVGRDGVLFDGRHRLWAIVEAGVAVPMLFVRGLDPISREAMDGGRVRSVGETVRLLDEERHGNTFVPWLKAIAVLHGQPSRGLSRHAMRAQIAHLRPSLHWLFDRCPKEVPYNRASILGALVYAHSVIGDRLEAFVRDYVRGENLSPGDPAHTLRLYVADRMRHVSDGDRAPHLKTLRCARAFLESEPIDRMPTSEYGYRYFYERDTRQLTLPLSA